MRITLTFLAEEPVILPIHYNELIQGFLYHHLDQSLAAFLHDQGYTFEKRKYTLFTFSRILGKARIKNDSIQFFSPFRLVISSPLEKILSSLAEHLVRAREIKIGDNRLILDSIEVGFKPEINGEMEIKMLSPVTVYSTLTTKEGRKKTYYYNPKEREFTSLVESNLRKKYFALNEREPEEARCEIVPLSFRKEDEKILKYKGFTIKGWMGRYLLKGNPELLQLAYDAGIGSKNSQGFGCFELRN